MSGKGNNENQNGSRRRGSSLGRLLARSARALGLSRRSRSQNATQSPPGGQGQQIPAPSETPPVRPPRTKRSRVPLPGSSPPVPLPRTNLPGPLTRTNPPVPLPGSTPPVPRPRTKRKAPPPPLPRIPPPTPPRPDTPHPPYVPGEPVEERDQGPATLYPEDYENMRPIAPPTRRRQRPPQDSGLPSDLLQILGEELQQLLDQLPPDSGEVEFSQSVTNSQNSDDAEPADWTPLTGYDFNESGTEEYGPEGSAASPSRRRKRRRRSRGSRRSRRSRSRSNSRSGGAPGSPGGNEGSQYPGSDFPPQ
ncbi:hypothetical protein HDE_04926 [Halotydeus destructor]|nr:hypothetical protein HDE_04926 [Halotydeus destructor]